MSTRSEQTPGDGQTQTESAAVQEQESLLGSFYTSVVLVRQAWADQLALFKTEANLAVKSLALIAALAAGLALLGILIGITLLGGFAYFLAFLGLHGALVFLLVLLVLALLVGASVWGIMSLSKTLGFPASRQALAQWSQNAQSKPEQGQGTQEEEQ